MDKRDLRYERSRRIVFVGCQFCGDTRSSLRNCGHGKICPACLKRKQEGAIGLEKDGGHEGGGL